MSLAGRSVTAGVTTSHTVIFTFWGGGGVSLSHRREDINHVGLRILTRSSPAHHFHPAVALLRNEKRELKKKKQLHAAGGVKRVTLLLNRLMSNSDELFSKPLTDRPAAERGWETQTGRKSTLHSAVILLPSPVDDKLVFEPGCIWAKFVVGAKSRVHANSEPVQSFRSGSRKHNKCVERASSVFSPHLRRLRLYIARCLRRLGLRMAEHQSLLRSSSMAECHQA